MSIMPVSEHLLSNTAEPLYMLIIIILKGQRPTAWIDWSEVHKTLSGWAGYAIIEIAAAPIK
jgi:hypothetical protein